MGVERVDEAAFEDLKRTLADVDESDVRAALRDSGLPMDPLVEGVRQGTLDELARTLCALSAEYEAAEPARKRAVRGLVITAKEHAGFAARNPKSTAEHRAEKEEMILWLRTWLENPGLFGVWVALRRRSASPGPQ